MEEFKFNTLDELYKKLLPAFRTKVNECKRNNILIKEIDIWNYLKDNYWKTRSDLTLDEMVDNILNCSNNDLISYLLNKR